MKMIKNMSDRLNENIPEVLHPLQSINDAILSYKEYATLPRYAKGYFYEMELQQILEDKRIPYEGNHKQFEEWKKTTNTGYDIKIKNLKGIWISIEAKFTLKPIAHCWFTRDWLSRIASIFVTNDKFNVSYRDRRLLEQHHKMLFSTTEFKMYLDKLMYKGNHYKWNILSTITNIIYKKIKNVLKCVEYYIRLAKYTAIIDSSIAKTQQKPPLLECDSCKRIRYSKWHNSKRRRCPDCNTILTEVRKALCEGKVITLYPKSINEPNISKTYGEYRYWCANCKKEWMYDSLLRYFFKVPKDSQFYYSEEQKVLLKRKQSKE